MSFFVRLPLDVAIRIAALVALDWAFARLYEAVVPPPVGADIGEGLLGFMLTMTAAAVWAAVDGRNRSFRRLAVTWVIVGVAAGIAMTAGTQLDGYAPPDWTVFRSDLRDVAPFLAGLVIVPALGAGGLVTALRRVPGARASQ